jgi:hypothetical protein
MVPVQQLILRFRVMGNEKLKLIRYAESDQGTQGVILFGSTYLHTGELPWDDNRPNVSCIPTGVHPVSVRISPRYGKCYTIGVEGRSYILFHQGNYFGRKSVGLRSHTNGCILLGSRRGRLNSQKAVLSSRTARSKFENTMNWVPFNLEVVFGWNG